MKIFPNVAAWWSALENQYLSFPNSKEDVKPQYEKIIMSSKTFIKDTKHDLHSKVPKIRVEHRCAPFQFNPRSHSKTTITFSTELRLRWFKRHVKANSLIYPHQKSQIFSDPINTNFFVKSTVQNCSQFQCILRSLQ